MQKNDVEGRIMKLKGLALALETMVDQVPSCGEIEDDQSSYLGAASILAQEVREQVNELHASFNQL